MSLRARRKQMHSKIDFKNSKKDLEVRINRLNLLVEHSTDQEELKRATWKMEKLMKTLKEINKLELDVELDKARADAANER